MSEIRFTVIGNPIPKARAVVTSHGAYTPERTKSWEAQVKDAARLAMDGRPPLEGPVSVVLTFYRKTKHRVDGDNLTKAALDACTGVLWLDDDQVLDMFWRKRLDRDNPRAVVRVWELGDVEW